MSRQHALMRMLFMALALFAASLGFAAGYPDVAPYAIPSPAPSLPSGMDPFSPPVNSATPTATAPAFAEWTRTGQPDDNLVVTGSNLSTYAGVQLGMDTNFLVYGQNSSGSALLPAKIQRLDAQKGAITLDATLPTWSMYLLWAHNSNGYGRPVAINRTDAWWLGPDQAAAGASVSVYGRNLSYQNGTTTSWVYIQQAGSAGQWVTPTAVNPYKVTFTIPNLATGSYLVWVHNGHGQNYGWSGPLTLTVNSGPGWTSTQFNVKNYGATGSGATDDTTAIQNCITAAANTPYSTVYFPAGTYLVSNALTPPSNIRWMGAGMSSTTIECAAAFNTAAIAMIDSESGLTNAEFDDMTLNANMGCGSQGTLVRIRYGTGIRFTDVAFLATGYSAVDTDASNYVYFTGCDVTAGNTSGGTFLGSGRQLFIDQCNFYGTDDCNTMWTGWARSQISCTNSTGQDLNDSNPLDGTGWAQGRFFYGGGAWGPSRDTYVGDNTTYDLEVRSGYTANQNTGEQYLVGRQQYAILGDGCLCHRDDGHFQHAGQK